MDLKFLTIDAARTAVQERQTTALALAEAHYARIQKEDGQICAFLTLSKERALEQADRMDRMAAEGKTVPALGGVPGGIEEVMRTGGGRAHAGARPPALRPPQSQPTWRSSLWVRTQAGRFVSRHRSAAWWD